MDRVLTGGRAPQRGKTPLWLAACTGHCKVVQLLVQADADKDAPNEVSEGSWGMLCAQTVHVSLAAQLDC